MYDVSKDKTKTLYHWKAFVTSENVEQMVLFSIFVELSNWDFIDGAVDLVEPDDLI
jgi:hypothetical protein